MNEPRREDLSAVVPESLAGARLDRALAELFPDFSRSRLQQWVKDGRCTVNGKPGRNKDKLVGGERVEVVAEFEDQVEPHPQDIPLDLVFEDRYHF